MAWDPTQQGQPGSGPGQDTYSGYGAHDPYGAPQPQPMTPVRSVGQSIQELPQQYIKVVMHPSDATFAAEIPKAGWPMVWVQLGILVIASVILGLIATAIASAVVRSATSSSSAAAAITAFAATATVTGAFLNIILIPLFFFIGVGIQYMFANFFIGEGTFLEQAYTQLLYKVPLTIASTVIGTVFAFNPIVGGLIGLAFFMYSVLLNIFQIKAVHGLTGGKAAAVVLIPYAFVLVCGLLVTLAGPGFNYCGRGALRC
jgi:hypothetical protein